MLFIWKILLFIKLSNKSIKRRRVFNMHFIKIFPAGNWNAQIYDQLKNLHFLQILDDKCHFKDIFQILYII